MSDLVDLKTHNPKPQRWIHTLAGVLSLLVGGLVLLGWQFDVGFLKSLNLEWVSMKGSKEFARSRSSRWVSRLQGSGGLRADSLQWARGQRVVCQGELMGWRKQERAGPTQSPQ